MINIKRFIKFNCVGILNFTISISFYYLFLTINMYYVVANIISYCIGMINSYILNKLWVFEKKDKNLKYGVKFIIVNITGIAASSALLLFIKGYLGINAYYSQIIVTGIIYLLNYFLNSKWTFHTS